MSQFVHAIVVVMIDIMYYLYMSETIILKQRLYNARASYINDWQL